MSYDEDFYAYPPDGWPRDGSVESALNDQIERYELAREKSFEEKAMQDASNEANRRLTWTETFDDDGNSIWEADSAFVPGPH